MRRGVALLLLAALCGAPASALAAGKRRVAVLDVVTDGLSADVRSQFETTIEEQLRKLGYEVIPHATVADVENKHDDLSEGCAFGPCVTPIARALGVERLLVVRINAEGQSYSFVVSAVEPSFGASVAQEVATCGVCTVAEALAKMSTSVAALENQRRVVRDDATGRIVKMEPPRRSKVLPIVLVVTGLALSGGGAVIVSQTDHPEPGWATIGSGGTVLLTGLVMLIAGD